ncbi:MAG: hypothetical protein ISR61_03510 [Desulfobacteraceae bacterium]|uniref:Uncharacterized protein n=1 Tax=Candidatus Desulfacyla euxinica TaxID=2841693 RepID=A0A8J6MYK8_9DELT|nr:hypothetical protein [Candidatus Desulfacyla euxinica]MBL6977990.1 hypothetical protein [Desulfobacteraceae bacterium]
MKVQVYKKGGFELVTKELNRRKAIRERCLNCLNWSPKAVAQCFANKCQLYPYRSGQGKQDAAARAKAIRGYCLDFCCVGQPYEVQKCVSRYCPLFAYRHYKTDRSVECTQDAEKGHIRGYEATAMGDR